MKTTFQPIEDRVLIRPTEAETITSGGIVLPDSAQERPATGTVISVGPGRLSPEGKRLSPSVTPGDVIVFGRYAGNEMELDGQEHRVLRADEILAKIQN